MKQIPLTKGYVALVDDADYEWLSKSKWYVQVGVRGIYALRSIWTGSKHTTRLMHREILGITDRAVEVDHIDHDGLNNQRTNLRACSTSQNQGNARRKSTNKSGIKGVSWYRRDSVWQASINIGGKKKYLGLFPTKEAAGEAYEAAARKSFGEFAYADKAAQ